MRELHDAREAPVVPRHPDAISQASNSSTGSSSPGATSSGNQKTLPRTKLLDQLKKHRGRAAFRHEEERRERLASELQKARLTGVRFKVPAERW